MADIRTDLAQEAHELHRDVEGVECRDETCQGYEAHVVQVLTPQAAQALEPYGTKLSLHASAGVLTGADGSAGLTPAALNASVDRVWVSGPRSDVLSALEGAGVVNAADRLVSLVDQLDPAAADAQAVWSE